jgi:predicted  nucleic acid-binding Zn ribbon protein
MKSNFSLDVIYDDEAHELSVITNGENVTVSLLAVSFAEAISTLSKGNDMSPIDLLREVHRKIMEGMTPDEQWKALMDVLQKAEGKLDESTDID